VYEQAYRLGLKGCTSYRPNPVTGAILTSGDGEPVPDSHCCSLNRADD
jgi:ribonucleoside-diphosphate reductase alpha chain